VIATERVGFSFCWDLPRAFPSSLSRPIVDELPTVRVEGAPRLWHCQRRSFVLRRGDILSCSLKMMPGLFARLSIRLRSLRATTTGANSPLALPQSSRLLSTTDRLKGRLRIFQWNVQKCLRDTGRRHLETSNAQSTGWRPRLTIRIRLGGGDDGAERFYCSGG